MPGNRKKAEAIAIELIGKLTIGNNNNVEIYKNMFKNMTDKDFDEFIVRLEKGEIDLFVVCPNGDNAISVENNFALAKELGYDFYQRLWLNDGPNTPTYLSNNYLVMDLPIKRQAQLLIKKISIPKDNKTIDNLTGQPTGSSKGSSMSYPQVQVLTALNLENCAIEFMKYRGGDLKGFTAMEKAIFETGGVDLEQLNKLGTKVKSTTTLSHYLTAMHLTNTLPR